MIKVNFPINKKNKDKLLNFYNLNWKSNLSLFNNKKVFKWLYFVNKKYAFIVLEKNNQILSSIGLIFNSYRDKTIEKIIKSKNQIIWLTIWCSDLKSNSFNKLQIINYIMKLSSNCSTIATVGCNIVAYKIYKALGFKCGYLNHYYFLNSDIKNFKLIKTRKISLKKTKKKIYLEFLSFRKNYNNINNLDLYEKNFKKDKYYYKKKYDENKFYRYNFLFVKNKNVLNGFFVCREDNYLNSKCLRLVEYFGNTKKIPFLGNDFQYICSKNKYEYIDFYNYGIKKKFLTKIGFVLKSSKEEIIPNYFNPFIKKNILLRYAYFPKKNKMIIFKGDCDQDRPNT